MNIRYSALIIMFFCMPSMMAKFYEPKDQAHFYKYIERHGLVIVFFEPFVATEKEEDKLEGMEDSFEALRKRNRYKDADVAFIAVNLDVLPELIDDFRLSEEKPTIMLFADGKVVKIGDKPLKKEGFLDKKEIKNFIEEHFGKEIDKRVQKKEKEAKERETSAARTAEKSATMRTQQAMPATQSTQKVIYQQPTTSTVRYVTYPSRSYTYYPSYSYSPGYYGGYGYRPYGGFGVGVGPFGFGFGFGGGRRWGRRGWW